MKDLKEIAANYAVGKTNEVMDKAIAQAYSDGYRDGYKDREEEIPVNLRDNKTEYVDLGLPSRTLWAKDYNMKDGKIQCLPYVKASLFNLPSNEQWEELLRLCRWEFKRDNNSSAYKYYCLGPNGNSLVFYSIPLGGFSYSQHKIQFWLQDDNNEDEKNAVYMDYIRNPIKEIRKEFIGNWLPVRSVLNN